MKEATKIPTPMLVANIATFQLGWFACVIGAARGWTWQAPLVVAAIAMGWLWASPRPRAVGLLIALSGVVGFCWDSWLAALGLVGYAPGALTPPLAPAWILALWVLFATTLPVSLRWLRSRPVLAAALGAITAPISYYGGARLGALSLPHLQPALWAEAAGWALLLPLLLLLSRRLDV